MAGNTPNQVLKQGQKRIFLQPGGAGANNPLLLAEVNYGPSRISNVVRNIRGSIANIPQRNAVGQGYHNIGSMETAPGFDTFELGIKETLTGIPLAAVLGNCPIGVFEVSGNNCNNLTDINLGYAGSYVEVFGDSTPASSVTRANGAAYTDDNEIEDVVPMVSLSGIFKHGQLFMSPLATGNAADLATTITTDVTYGNQQICQSCGRGDDGTYAKYWSAAATTASPGAKPFIFYQLGTNTPVPVQVSSAAVAENLTGIAVVGNYLVVISATAGGAGIGGYHYAQIGASGAPGTWTKVTAGFQANHEPTDILVSSASEIYFPANGGWIYKSNNLLNGVTVNNGGANTTNNLGRIQGNSGLLVAVGATGAVIYSANGGTSWAAPLATPPASNPTWGAVDVIGDRTLWLGSATGRLFVSYDRGATWAESTFDQSGTGAISDIYFVNAYEGYFVHTVGGQGRIFRTVTGGQSWSNLSPAIEGLSSYTALGRIAAPTVGNETVKSNNVLLSGTVTGTQGLLLSGTGRVF